MPPAITPLTIFRVNQWTWNWPDRFLFSFLFRVPSFLATGIMGPTVASSLSKKLVAPSLHTAHCLDECSI